MSLILSIATTKAGMRHFAFGPTAVLDSTTQGERIIAIAEQGIHRSHFGFPNFFVPFITTTAACMNLMTQR
jgi:hypothetical protein